MLVTNLARFGGRELALASRLLNAISNGFPEDFDCDFDTAEVKIAFNPYSGDVFLTNNSYQVCTEEDGELLSYYNTPYDGLEGTYEDLLQEYINMCPEDQEWFRDLTKNYYSSYILPVLSCEGVWLEEGDECYVRTNNDTLYEEFDWSDYDIENIPVLYQKEENVILDIIEDNKPEILDDITYEEEVGVWLRNGNQISREDLLCYLWDLLNNKKNR